MVVRVSNHETDVVMCVCLCAYMYISMQELERGYICGHICTV